MAEEKPRCLVCDQTSDQIPLLSITYQGKIYAICPQHFPISHPHRSHSSWVSTSQSIPVQQMTKVVSKLEFVWRRRKSNREPKTHCLFCLALI